jgi:hypothetical protein
MTVVQDGTGNAALRLDPLHGGRVCSLHYRPRRWFGCRLERIVSDFVETRDPRLSGLPRAVGDLLIGAVRNHEDRRVMVSAHHSPEKALVRVTVTIFYALPTEDPVHLDAIVEWLGRGNKTSKYYRLGTPDGALPVKATLNIRSTRLRGEHGESQMVTTLTATARAVMPKANEPRPIRRVSA